MDSTDPQPRGPLRSWISPDADSPWAALYLHTVVWAALTLVWILYLALADGPGYRLALYPVLALVGLIQVGGYLSTIKEKRKKESSPEAT